MAGPGRGAGPDFEEYAAARRPDLVRLGVLLGHSAGHAAVLADRALARAARAWPRLRREPDPDTALKDLLLEQRELSLASGEAGSADDASRTDVVSLPEGLRADLDRLSPQARVALAWAALGHEDHAGAGRPDPRLLEAVRTAVPTVPVPPPTGATPLRGRGPRGTRLRVAALVGVVVLLGALLTVLLPDPVPAPPPLGPVAISPARNPAPVAWYADGRLHLAGGIAAVDGVVALVELGEQVVYLDDRGDVVRLGADGARVRLGRADPAVGLVAAAAAGRVAWLGEDGVTLEVADVPAAEVVARLEVRAGARPVRFAAPVLVFADADAEHEWDTVTGSVVSVPRDPEVGTLVDVVGVTQLRQVDAASILVRQPAGTPVVRRGDGGEVSPGQEFVWTRSGEGGTGVRVFAVGTGQEVASGTGREDVVLDARFTGSDEVTYLLADRAAVPGPSEAGRMSSTGPLEVRTCQVGTARCRLHTSGTGAGDSTALLAR